MYYLYKKTYKQQEPFKSLNKSKLALLSIHTPNMTFSKTEEESLYKIGIPITNCHYAFIVVNRVLSSISVSL